VSPTRRLFIGAIVLLAAASGYAAGRVLFRPLNAVEQPIAFDHQRHVTELELECVVCHQFYESSRHAGLPLLTTCLECHDDRDVESEELKKILELADKGEDDVFRKLFKLADHAFYSHRRHAKIEEIPCATCHGEIAGTSSPPSVPLVRISMDFCVDCHEEEGATTDCTRCHR
jgi:hypothetical protein